MERQDAKNGVNALHNDKSPDRHAARPTTGESQQPPEQAPPAPKPSASRERETRLAEQLRANLLKRKAQARARGNQAPACGNTKKKNDT